ncbi:PAS domain-containing protein [Streptomyces sp. I4(2020)]|uniref:PAS domain-containing protein n=1 Tax=Streptomyces sp. I4(2020) TaxID=2760981 RepID=UPI0018EE5D5C|nr:PAS domain-containing protein [Streptomyces sp. I4(2020)]MBJ6612773.1 hypothetical protein [Streptomyces sp. I3(2020)]MBJ6629189.1 hypothetical protein [Streptomyces sp. I4(2020)]
MVTLDQLMSSADLSDTALAVLDDGTVTGWTLEAQRLTGREPGEAVGRTAARLLPAVEDRLPARDGLPGPARIRHRDGRVPDVTLRISRLRGSHGAVRRLMSLVDTAAPPRGEPVGVVVRGPDLRCVGVNDTAERHDGVPAGGRPPAHVLSVLVDGVLRPVAQSMKGRDM